MPRTGGPRPWVWEVCGLSTLAHRLPGVPAGGRDGAAEVRAHVAPRLRPALERLADGGAVWLEVRLRLGRPVQVVTVRGDLWAEEAGPCSAEDLERTVQLVTRASVYAWEGELAQGFCTLPGGHRAGLCGRALLRDGRIAGQKDFGSINLRIARAVPGAADPLLPLLRAGAGIPPGLLLFGPPGCGKTTVLRDLCRQLSAGRPECGLPPRRVALVDERSEIAATVAGNPQFDIGPRTDVLDGAPKAVGLGLLLRALNPEVCACDEIGGPGDARALAEVARCGVGVLATAHAGGVADLLARPGLRAALRSGAFAYAVPLRADRTPGAAVPLPRAARQRRLSLAAGEGPAWPQP